MTKFANHKKKLLKNYKLHSKLYKLNLEDTMASCFFFKNKNLNDELMKYNLHKSNILYNIRKSNLNLDVWWPPSL